MSHKANIKYFCHSMVSRYWQCSSNILLLINAHLDPDLLMAEHCHCSGYKDPEYSRGCLSKALGQLGFWEFGGGGLGERWGKGGSVYKQPETEVDDSCHS